MKLQTIQYYYVVLCIIATCTFFRAASADEVTVSWYIPSDGVLDPITVNVGDTVVFEWSGFHNVYIHPAKSCDEAGAIEVGTQTGASYTFTENDEGEIGFACDVGPHCEFGQILTVTVLASSTTTIAPTMTPSVVSSTTTTMTGTYTDSPVPTMTGTYTDSPVPTTTTMFPTTYSQSTDTRSGTPTLIAPPTNPVEITVEWFISSDGFDPISANVGDTVIFEWGNFHNVYIHPTKSCDETGAIEVGTQTGASHTFTASDVGEVVFACDVGPHCELGQIITVVVS